MAGQIVLSPGQLVALLEKFQHRNECTALNEFMEAAMAEGQEFQPGKEAPSGPAGGARPGLGPSRALKPVVLKTQVQTTV